MNAQVTYDDDMNAYVWRNSAGEFHRDDGPAVEFNSGYRGWWQNGQRHRTDGPAIEYADGDRCWWIDGEELTEEEFNKRTKPAEKTIVLDGVTYRLVKV